jgi:pentatricopeptide repeat protein
MGSAPTDIAKHISMMQNYASKGDLEACMSVFRALQNSGADLTNSIFNTVLDACVECQDPKKTAEWMERMKKEGFADDVSYNTLIKAELRHSGVEKAREVMNQMREAGFSPNHVTYNEIINAVVRGQRGHGIAQVWEIVSEMQAAGVQPNRVTCSILLKNLSAKSSEDDVAKTMNLTDAMDEAMDEVLLSSIVEACVRVGKADLLLTKLRQLQGKPGVVINGAHTFGSLIKAYGCAGDIEGCWRCWKQMRSRHIQPTSVTIGCMVEAVVSNGDVDAGYLLIQQLMEDEQSRGQVNAVVYCSVLKGYSRARNMDRVWSVWEQLLSRGIVPSVVTFNAMVDACARNGRMDAVPDLVKDMQSRGLKPNLVTYCTMLKGLCQRGDVPAALRVLREMRRAGLRPDEITYNTLLDGCAQNNLAAEGERLLEEMENEGIAPSNYTLSVLVKLMGNCRNLDRAFELVEKICGRYRFKANAYVDSNLVQACVANRAFPRAIAVYERMKRDWQQVDMRTYQVLLRGGITAGAHVEVINLLREALGLDAPKDVKVVVEDGIVQEILESLASSSLSKEAAGLIPLLLRDIGRRRPGFRMDAATHRRFGALGR